MPVIVIADSSRSQERPPIDLVLIHDLFLDFVNGPRDIATDFGWLHQSFPHVQYGCRILAYDYSVHDSKLPAERLTSLLPKLAHAFIEDLAAIRRVSDASRRPLIFLCHGIGGLVVKLALSHSCNPLSEPTEDSQAVCQSTYGVVFVGTPHNGITDHALSLLSAKHDANTSQLLTDLLTDSELIIRIASRFSPMLDHVNIYNVWEQLDTSVGDQRCRIVDQSSAVPASHIGERGAIMACHADMLHFRGPDDQGYSTIVNILKQYIMAAQRAIRTGSPRRQSVSRRSISGQRYLHQGHTLEQGFISGGNVHLGDVYYNYGANIEQPKVRYDEGRSPSITSEQVVLNEHYVVPRSSTARFIGRQVFADEVKIHFRASVSNPVNLRPRVAIIHGLGGSGKTQFCLRYAENNRSSYWGVFWIDASTHENGEAGFAQLGCLASKGATYSAGRYWLAQSLQPWLLILDNADDPQLEISDFIPPGGHGDILITTRNPNMVVNSAAKLFKLQEMDREEAVTLLLQTAYPLQELDITNTRHRTLAGRIAAELGYLAIALDHAGTTIRRKIYTIERYLHHYLGYRDRLVTSSKPLSVDETSIVTTWELPFRRIEKQDIVDHRDAVVLVYLFAFMHFSSIPERIFHVLWTTSNEHFCSHSSLPSLLEPVAFHFEEARPRLRRAIAVLREHSIIEHDADRESCALHPVIHRWARTRPQGQEDPSRWLECTVEVLARCISPNLEASGRQFRRELLPHIESVGQLLNFQSQADLLTTERADQLERFAWVYAENGIWKSAFVLQSRIIKFRTRKLGRAHESTLRAIRSLVDVHWNLFEVESAVKLQDQIRRTRWWFRPSIMDWRYFLRPDHVEYCVALDKLTQILWLAGRRALSKQVGERAVAGLLKRLGPDDPLTISAMFNLGRTYIHNGDLDKAHALLPTVLRSRRKFFGPNHPETLMAQNELGVCFLTSEKHLATAERLITNALQARKRILGEEHAYTLWSVNDLSKVLCKRDRPSEAVKVLQHIIPIAERTLGHSHIGTVMTKGNLVRAYISWEKWNDAENIILEVLPLVQDNLTSWLDTIVAYARVKTKTGRLWEAETDYQALLHKIEQTKMWSSEDSRTLLVKKRLAEVQSEIILSAVGGCAGRPDQI